MPKKDDMPPTAEDLWPELAARKRGEPLGAEADRIPEDRMASGAEAARLAAGKTRIPDLKSPERNLPPPGVARAASIPPMGIAGCACEPRSAEESIDDPHPLGPWDLDPKCIHHGHLWRDPETGQPWHELEDLGPIVDPETRAANQMEGCTCEFTPTADGLRPKYHRLVQAGCPVHDPPETSAEPQVRLDLADDAIAASAKNLTLQLLELAKKAAGEIAHAKTGDQTGGLLLAVQTCVKLAADADDLGDKSAVRAELAAAAQTEDPWVVDFDPVTRAVVEHWLELLLSNDEEDTQRLHDEIVAVLGSTP